MFDDTKSVIIVDSFCLLHIIFFFFSLLSLSFYIMSCFSNDNCIIFVHFIPIDNLHDLSCASATCATHLVVHVLLTNTLKRGECTLLFSHLFIFYFVFLFCLFSFFSPHYFSFFPSYFFGFCIFFFLFFPLVCVY
jgi:hypothetical protein